MAKLSKSIKTNNSKQVMKFVHKTMYVGLGFSKTIN